MASMSGVPVPNVRLEPTSAATFSAKGLSVAVVGGTGGIGRAIARFLVSKGAKVTVVGRTFRDSGIEGLEFLKADLSLMSEARRVANELPAETLDALILTTGIITGPTKETTPEGYEADLAISYLSRVEILRGVAERLGTARPKPAARPRVFVMGFPGTESPGDPADLNSDEKYEQWPAHMQTVAGNEALVIDAARKYPQLAVFGLNPGLIATDIRANALGGTSSLKFKAIETVIGWFTPKPETYAARLVPVLFSPGLDAHSGLHLNSKGVLIASSKAMDAAHVAAFVTATDSLLARTSTGA